MHQKANSKAGVVCATILLEKADSMKVIAVWFQRSKTSTEITHEKNLSLCIILSLNEEQIF